MSEVTISIPAAHTERFRELTEERLEAAADKLGGTIGTGVNELRGAKDHFGHLHALYEEIDLGNDVEVTAEVAALREVLDWGIYKAGNALECACRAKERDLADIRRQLEEARFFVDQLQELGDPLAVA
jgi:hypothetical protein